MTNRVDKRIDRGRENLTLIQQSRRIQIEFDRRIQQSCSPSLPLNDENRFVVDLILFSNLQSMFVTFSGVLQQRIADVSC